MGFKTQEDKDDTFVKGHALSLFKANAKNKEGIIQGTGVTTHGAVVMFGRHAQQLITRVPFDYLRWGVNNSNEGQVVLADGRQVSFCRAAMAEIERRGDRMDQKFEISGHAIDRLSDRFFEAYIRDRNEKEGILSWANRKLAEVVLCQYDGTQVFDVYVNRVYGRPTRIRFVVDFQYAIPVLKTVK